jgi:hypothetical protein
MKKKHISGKAGLAGITGLLVVAAALVMVAGCSTISGIDISPPSWARGTWTAYEGAVTFKFLSDNIVYTDKNNVTISFVKQYAGMQVTDESSDTSYTVTIIDVDKTIVYSFTLSGDVIIYQVYENDAIIDSGGLTKETTS